MNEYPGLMWRVFESLKNVFAKQHLEKTAKRKFTELLSLSHGSTGLEISTSTSSLICWHTQAHTQSNWEARWRRAEMSSGSGDGDVGVINFVGSLGPWASEPLPFIFYQVQESPLLSLQLVALLQGSPALSVPRSYLRLVPATWLQED